VFHPERRKARARQRALQERNRARVYQQAAAHSIPIVIPWKDWLILAGISASTGERLVKARKIRLTWLSEHRRGVTSDEHRRYVNACTDEI
jgi:hypothetical protein